MPHADINDSSVSPNGVGTVLTVWKIFLKEWHHLLVGLLAVAALPCISDLLLFLGPPWPERSQTSSLTSVINAAVLISTAEESVGYARPGCYVEGS